MGWCPWTYPRWLRAESDEEARFYPPLIPSDEYEGISDPAPPRKQAAGSGTFATLAQGRHLAGRRALCLSTSANPNLVAIMLQRCHHRARAVLRWTEACEGDTSCREDILPIPLFVASVYLTVRRLIMAICELCEVDSALQESHIVPEFLYGDLYDEKHRMIGIHGLGRKGTQFVQKGIREKLLCFGCEQHLNDKFEKPFLKAWIESNPLPNPWKTDDVHWIKVNYREFKLFHLSVLFRAGVSTLPMFSEVSLGAHEKTMREMLLSCDPGPEDLYPVAACAVVHHTTNEIVQIVTRAQKGRLEGKRCYGIVYGGAQWWISVDKDPNLGFKGLSLLASGAMPIARILWNEILPIQEAHYAVKRAEA